MIPLDEIAGNEITEFIKNNDKELIKDYLNALKENLGIITIKYIRLVISILICSGVYILFALQITETLTLSFVTINKPFIVEYFFPLLYLFLILRFAIIEKKLSEYYHLISSILVRIYKPSLTSNAFRQLLFSYLNYNFIIDINQKMFDKNTTTKSQIALIPIYFLMISPIFLTFYALYRLILHIKEHPFFIVLNLLCSVWLIFSIFIEFQKVIKNIDFDQL